MGCQLLFIGKSVHIGERQGTKSVLKVLLVFSVGGFAPSIHPNVLIYFLVMQRLDSKTWNLQESLAARILEVNQVQPTGSPLGLEVW